MGNPMKKHSAWQFVLLGAETRQSMVNSTIFIASNFSFLCYLLIHLERGAVVRRDFSDQVQPLGFRQQVFSKLRVS